MRLPASLIPQLGMYPQATRTPLSNVAAGQQSDQQLTQPVQPRRPRQPRPAGALARMAVGPQATSTY